MKKLLTISILIFALGAEAAQVAFSFTNSLNLPDTNYFKVIPCSQPSSVDGSVITSGVPIRLTPATDGKITNSFAAGHYLVTNQFLGSGFVIRVPLDNGNTVYCGTCFTSNGGLVVSGLGNFVTITYGTNPPPTFDEVTNALTFLPLTTNQVNQAITNIGNAFTLNASNALSVLIQTNTANDVTLSNLWRATNVVLQTQINSNTVNLLLSSNRLAEIGTLSNQWAATNLIFQTQASSNAVNILIVSNQVQSIAGGTGSATNAANILIVSNKLNTASNELTVLIQTNAANIVLTSNRFVGATNSLTVIDATNAANILTVSNLYRTGTNTLYALIQTNAANILLTSNKLTTASNALDSSISAVAVNLLSTSNKLTVTSNALNAVDVTLAANILSTSNKLNTASNALRTLTYSLGTNSTNYAIGISNVLQAGINLREPAIAAGATNQFWRNDKTWQDYSVITNGVYLFAKTLSTNATNFTLLYGQLATNFTVSASNSLYASIGLIASTYATNNTNFTKTFGTNATNLVLATSNALYAAIVGNTSGIGTSGGLGTNTGFYGTTSIKTGGKITIADAAADRVTVFAADKSLTNSAVTTVQLESFQTNIAARVANLNGHATNLTVNQGINVDGGIISQDFLGGFALYSLSDNLSVAESLTTVDELNFLAGVTSEVQPQLNGKAPTTNPVFTNSATVKGTLNFTNGGGNHLVVSNLAANRLLVSGADKSVTNSSVTATEAGYLSGVTSALQTQLNAKLNNTDGIATNSLTVKGNLAVGTNATLNSATVTNKFTNQFLTASQLVFTDSGKALASSGTSANIAASVSDEQGSGALVFSFGSFITNTFSVNPTNSSVRLIGTNIVAAALEAPVKNVTVTAGDNGIIDGGTNTSLRLTGATGEFSISGIQGSYGPGRIKLLINATPQYPMVLKNETGGDATNRISTGFGGDITNHGYGAALFYSDAISRWTPLFWHNTNVVANMTNTDLSFGQKLTFGGATNYIYFTNTSDFPDGVLMISAGGHDWMLDSISGNLMPGLNNLYDLGRVDYQLKDAHFGGDVAANTGTFAGAVLANAHTVDPDANGMYPSADVVGALDFYAGAFTKSIRILNNAILPIAEDFGKNLGEETNRFDYVYSTNLVTKSLTAAIKTVSSAYTATAQDFTILCSTTSAGFTVALPAAATVTGQIFNIKKISSDGNTLTIDPNGAETIDGSATKTTTTQWTNFRIQSNGTAWFVL